MRGAEEDGGGRGEPKRVMTIRVAKAAKRKPVSDRILAQRADRRQPIRGVV